MYQITVERSFSAAHALRLTDGSSEPVHGHDWHVTVSVASEHLDGMDTVMDFHELERILQEIVAPFCNRNLNDVQPFAAGSVNPSAEQVAWWVGSQAGKRLPENVSLVQVSVVEAPGCVATYRP